MLIVSYIKKILKWVVVAFFASTILSVIAYRFIPVFVTPLMLLRVAEQVKNGSEIKMKHHWVALESISPSLPVAVIASEDANFLNHHGFDFEAIQKAAKRNQEHPGKRKFGASTISQQTAKNVFLWPGRSWVRKGFEVYFTTLIELLWSKQRIMEVYLNSIEMGEGIYGAEAVAREHFNCSALELSRSRCALIAATLPNPRRFSSKHPSSYMLKRQSRIEREMKFVPKFPARGEDVKEEPKKKKH
jgi:monofunctional biosynthetic peptidoglycan transglycosylase